MKNKKPHATHTFPQNRPTNTQKMSTQKLTIPKQTKNEPKLKISKIYKNPINPDTDWHNPKNKNEPKTEKHPFLVRF